MDSIRKEKEKGMPDARVEQLRDMSIKLDQMTNTVNKLTEEARPNKAIALKTVENSDPELVDEILKYLEEKLKGKPKASKAAVIVALQHFTGANEVLVDDCVNVILSANRDTTKLDKVRKRRATLLAAYNAFKDYLEQDGIDTSSVKAPDTLAKNWSRATTKQRQARF